MKRKEKILIVPLEELPRYPLKNYAGVSAFQYTHWVTTSNKTAVSNHFIYAIAQKIVSNSGTTSNVWKCCCLGLFPSYCHSRQARGPSLSPAWVSCPVIQQLLLRSSPGVSTPLEHQQQALAGSQSLLKSGLLPGQSNTQPGLWPCRPGTAQPL